MRERTKKAFDFAAESTKLLITLSTGIIALTITFSKDFVPDLSEVRLWPIVTAWGCFLLSVIFGIATMLSLTGLLSGYPTGSGDEGAEIEPSVYAPSVSRKSLLQIVFFLLALGFTCVHGCESMSRIDDCRARCDNTVDPASLTPSVTAITKWAGRWTNVWRHHSLVSSSARPRGSGRSGRAG